MKLKHVIPDMEKTFGVLTYAGEDEAKLGYINGKRGVIERGYNLYSNIQRADNIMVILPASAGEKHFDSTKEEKVKLINPRIKAEAYKIGNQGFTDYVMYADDMVKL